MMILIMLRVWQKHITCKEVWFIVDGDNDIDDNRNIKCPQINNLPKNWKWCGSQQNIHIDLQTSANVDDDGDDDGDHNRNIKLNCKITNNL